MVAFRKVEAPIDLYTFPDINTSRFLTFCTGRSGGVSLPPFDTLNTDIMGGDKPDDVAENLDRIKKALGVEYVVTAKQVHGDDVLFVDENQPSDFIEADAIVTATAGVAVAVRTADCAPILMANSSGLVAAVHAGRAGVEKGIIEKTITFMRDKGGRESSIINVAIGPLIHSCCYEVDQESADRFHSLCGGKASRYIDLVSAILRQLNQMGVDKTRIFDSGVCTACSTDRFYSYRKEGGTTGRFLSGIMVK